VRYPDLKEEFKNTREPSLSQVRDAVRRVRARKAMLIQAGDPDCRSAGSFFKNPIVDEGMLAGETVPRYPAGPGKVKLSAAWLIEHAGVPRGFTMGAAGVSTKHTLALVNKGGATASDVIALARYIRRRVEDRFGVRLIPEPVFVGFEQERTLLS
jgi:UDP-N-acetylmuramate dehydrogenase